MSAHVQFVIYFILYNAPVKKSDLACGKLGLEGSFNSKFCVLNKILKQRYITTYEKYDSE